MHREHVNFDAALSLMASGQSWTCWKLVESPNTNAQLHKQVKVTAGPLCMDIICHLGYGKASGNSAPITRAASQIAVKVVTRGCVDG